VPIKSYITKYVFLLGLVLVIPQVGMACSKHYSTLDRGRNPAQYRYEYVAEVSGEREILAQISEYTKQDRVQALVVTVLKIIKNSPPEIKIGDEYTIFHIGTNPDCSEVPESYYLSTYPIGTKVYVWTDGFGYGPVSKYE
jgi:hypothetical protein